MATRRDVYSLLMRNPLEDGGRIYDAKNVLNNDNTILSYILDNTFEFSKVPVGDNTNWDSLDANSITPITSLNGLDAPSKDKMKSENGYVINISTDSEQNVQLVFNNSTFAYRMIPGEWNYAGQLSSDITNVINNSISRNQLNTALSTYITQNNLESTLSKYITTDKYNSDVSTLKTDVQNLIKNGANKNQINNIIKQSINGNGGDLNVAINNAENNAVSKAVSQAVNQAVSQADQDIKQLGNAGTKTAVADNDDDAASEAASSEKPILVFVTK